MGDGQHALRSLRHNWLSGDTLDDADRQSGLDDAGEPQTGAGKEHSKLLGSPFPSPWRHHQHLDVEHLGRARR